jgi:dGTPase
VKHVERLFQYFLKYPRRLPANYLPRTSRDPLHRVVCDYIAGMTDNYLELQYRKYVGQRGFPGRRR